VKKNRKHLDDFFREKLGSYSETPPADAWQELDARLDTLVPQAVPSSPLRWLGHVGMVSLIAILGVTLVPRMMGHISDNTRTAEAMPAETATHGSNERNVNAATPSGEAQAANGSVAVSDVATEGTSTEAPSNSPESKENGTTGSTQAAGVTAAAHKTGAAGIGSGQQEAAGKKATGNTHNAAGKQQGGGNHNQAKQSEPENGTIVNAARNNTHRSGKHEDDSYNSHAGSAANGVAHTETQNAPNEQLNSAVAGKALVTNKKTVADQKENVAEKAEAAAPKVDVVKNKYQGNRWEAGVKGGYERGLNNNPVTKYLISPYLQYNFSDKIAVMVQPAVKYANAPVRIVGKVQSYYKVNNDGVVKDNGSYTSIKVEGSTIDTYYNAKFRYTQTHDSIVKTNTTGGTYMEYELPVLMKYKFSEKLSVYGGVNVIYSQLQTVTEHTYTKAGIQRNVDTTISALSMPAAPALNDVINYQGNNISEYNGPFYPAVPSSRVRFGAMLGVTYQYGERWMLDALLLKNPAPKDLRDGYNINAPLSSTCLRLSVGYKITK
jgi:hypothetical protein